jgi:hypothetical protein
MHWQVVGPSPLQSYLKYQFSVSKLVRGSSFMNRPLVYPQIHKSHLHKSTNTKYEKLFGIKMWLQPTIIIIAALYILAHSEP